MGLCYTINWNPSDILHSENTGKQLILHCNVVLLFIVEVES